MTAARDELVGLDRLARCLLAQEIRPVEWVIVDDGSLDGTLALARQLAQLHAWIKVVQSKGGAMRRRGAQIAAALEAGFDAIRARPAVVVICDADVSMAPEYFRDLLARFRDDARLGIASGSRYEFEHGAWRQRYLTGTAVEAQCRAYASECLRRVRPLERSMGWDSVDEAKANAYGWRTQTFRELGFRHHRLIGGREQSRIVAWYWQGRGAHYAGYRPLYLLARALFRARCDPAAFGLICGYWAAALLRVPRCPDREAREYVRRQQRLRLLRSRLAEARGREVERAGVDLLLVADSGGHLLELALLSQRFDDGFSRAWVTLDKLDARSLLADEQTCFAHGPTSRNVSNLIRNLVLAWRIVGELRPRALVTTGAAVAVPFAWAARMRGCECIVYIEIFGATRASLSARLVRRVAERVYIQWPELESRLPGAVYVSPLPDR